MTAPDSRDSVERARQHIELVEMMRGPDRTGWGIAERLLDELLSTRLQALARGNRASGSHPDALPDGTFSKSTVKRRRVLQQAGGEARRFTVEGDIAYPVYEDPDGDYVLYTDYAALQAEVARLLGQNERLASAVRDTITRAETAEAALREADAASKEPR